MLSTDSFMNQFIFDSGISLKKNWLYFFYFQICSLVNNVKKKNSVFSQICQAYRTFPGSADHIYHLFTFIFFLLNVFSNLSNC